MVRPARQPPRISSAVKPGETCRPTPRFAADDTTIESERIETAIGELDCLRYAVRDGATEEVFWFAKDLPALPIQSLSRTDDQVVTTGSVADHTIA